MKNLAAVERCPVCEGQARAVMTLRAGEIRACLAEAMGAAVPDNLVIADYEMRQCQACSLVFADPMLPGDFAFYQWVTGFPHYHADARWEWGAMRRLLAARAGPGRLLDVGCGDGKFLASLKPLKSLEASGIDLSETNVARAKARLVNARRATLEELGREGARFDVVTLTHVLEHFADPIKVIGLGKSLLNPGGEILLSVPYSPTSGEALKPDIMNLPPHHLTRWNMASLERLAGLAGLELSYEMRKPKPVLKRAVRHMLAGVPGGADKRGFWRGAAFVASHPRALASAIALYRGREKIGGRRAADEILVRLALG